MIAQTTPPLKPAKTAARPFVERRILPSGYEHVHFNLHPGQQAALNSRKSITLVLAGVRSGKTVTGPLWLFRRMQAHGPGDYLIAAPTYPLIDKAAAPEIEHVLGRILKIGSLNKSPLEFRISKAGEQYLWPTLATPPERPTRIIFGHADEPESLEAMTIKDAWLDEAGQKKFKKDSFDNIRDRLSIDRGRVLITTRPFNLGWLKQKLYDAWEKAGRSHPLIDVVTFDSRMNPVFPPEEYERARAELPRSVFDMKYRGIFTQPAGLIYDAFDTGRHVEGRFAIPPDWQRFVGLDFGGVNTAAVFLAREPTKPLPTYHAYREYWPRTGRTSKEHVGALLAGEPSRPLCVGGSSSEGQWRAEFAAAGLGVMVPPVKEVEVGINRTYGLISKGQLRVFDDLPFLLEDLATYSRRLDDRGNPTEDIEDKESFHLLDALRYVASHLNTGRPPLSIGTPPGKHGNVLDTLPKGVFG